MATKGYTRHPRHECDDLKVKNSISGDGWDTAINAALADLAAADAAINAALADLEAAAAQSVKYVKVGAAEVFGDFTSGVAKVLAVNNVPATSMITQVICQVTDGFNSGTGDTLEIGTVSDPDAFLGAADITATAVGAYTKAVSYHVGPAALTLYATWTGEGTAPTAGGFDVYVGYIDL